MAIEIGSIVYLKSGSAPHVAMDIVGDEVVCHCSDPMYSGSSRVHVWHLSCLTEVDPRPFLERAFRDLMAQYNLNENDLWLHMYQTPISQSISK